MEDSPRPGLRASLQEKHSQNQTGFPGPAPGTQSCPEKTAWSLVTAWCGALGQRDGAGTLWGGEGARLSGHCFLGWDHGVLLQVCLVLTFKLIHSLHAVL